MFTKLERNLVDYLHVKNILLECIISTMKKATGSIIKFDLTLHLLRLAPQFAITFC